MEQRLLEIRNDSEELTVEKIAKLVGLDRASIFTKELLDTVEDFNRRKHPSIKQISTRIKYKDKKGFLDIENHDCLINSVLVNHPDKDNVKRFKDVLEKDFGTYTDFIYTLKGCFFYASFDSECIMPRIKSRPSTDMHFKDGSIYNITPAVINSADWDIIIKLAEREVASSESSFSFSKTLSNNIEETKEHYKPYTNSVYGKEEVFRNRYRHYSPMCGELSAGMYLFYIEDRNVYAWIEYSEYTM